MLVLRERQHQNQRQKKGDSTSSTTPPTPTPTTTVVAAPRLSATAKGKQPTRATTPTEPTDIERTEAEQLKIVLKRSRQETHISQQRGSDTDEGTGFRPGVPDVPSDDSEEELSWNSSDDEEGDEQTKGREESEGDKTDESDDGSDVGNNDDDDETVKVGSKSDKDDDDNNDEEEPAKNDDEDTESGKGGDEGRGLQVTQNIEDSHVTLTPVYPDGLQESSSVSSFVTSMLNPISDAGVESIFTTTSSPILSLQTPTPIMTPSTIATITTSKTSFSEYRQTNLFVDAVSAIPDKAILDTYEESTILKRRREDDDQEGPSAGLDRGSKRQREGGEHASASTLSETATGSAGRSTTGSQSRQLCASKSAFAEEPMQTTCQMEEPPHTVFETGADDNQLFKHLSILNGFPSQTKLCQLLKEMLNHG
nr:hypothetical protein [Tanacetum cinerariifolium]